MVGVLDSTSFVKIRHIQNAGKLAEKALRNLSSTAVDQLLIIQNVDGRISR